MKYKACIAADISCYADIEFEADSDEEAIQIAKDKARDTDAVMQPCWDNPFCEQRVVSLEREAEPENEMIAEGIEVCDRPLLWQHGDVLLQVAKDLLALMDEAPTGECASVTYDQEDRVFARYEFEPLRAIIAKCEGRVAP